MSYIRHAKAEFLALGYKPVEQCEDGPDKWIQENVLALLEMLSKQGHSGTSIHFALDYFMRLAKFEPLCPLTGEDSEWADVDGQTVQNKRCSHVFRAKNGTAYDINGYVFWHWSVRPLEPDEEGYPGEHKFKSHFSSKMSSKLVVFPYTPIEPTHIEVECYEVNKETGELEPGSGWWETVYPKEVIEAARLTAEGLSHD